MLFSQELFPTKEQELTACFKILLRNLVPTNWYDLIPEAQDQMLNEIKTVLQSSFLSPEQILHLGAALQKLESNLTSEQRSWLWQVFNRHSELGGFKYLFAHYETSPGFHSNERALRCPAESLFEKKAAS
jgi:hypothetical protein